MNISNRLKTIYNFIDKEDKVIDVGCDHALLSIYISLNKKNKHIIASDINEKPLEKAKENIKKYDLDKKIKIVCQDGIDNLYDSDTIILSGMGTSTILNILFKNNNLSNIKKIIISSNNDYYELRKTMNKNNFYIIDEEIVLENKKYYPIIVYKKGKERLNDKELKYGPILLKNKSKVFLKYINENKNKLLKIYYSLPNKYILKKMSIKKEIKSLEKI